jgi:FAD/FMN-containing dehydrogenase
VLCGSEGSLGFITEARLNITPIPRYRTLVNVKYDSFPSALRNAPFMVQAQALSVETVDSRVLGLARADIIWHSVKDHPGCARQGSAGLNIVEFADTDEDAHKAKVAELCRRIDGLARGEAGVIGYQVCDHLPSIETIYGMRKKSVGLLGNAEGARSRWPSPKTPPCRRNPWRTSSWSFAPCWTLTALTTACSATSMPGCCTCARRWTCAIPSRRCCCGASPIRWWRSPPNTAA